MPLPRFGRVVLVMALAVFMAAWVADPATAVRISRQVTHQTLVSVDSTGVLGNGASDQGVLSADGRFLTFVSTASNLVPGDTNQIADVFVKDLQAGTTERVSVGTAGGEGNAAVVGRPAISAGGRWVAFASAASNLVPGDQNSVSDVFVRDRGVMTTVRVSVSTAGLQGNASSEHPSISGDGKTVAFTSTASNLAPSDLNASSDVFVRNLRASTTTLVSVSSAGVRGNAASSDPSIGGNDRYVTFTSYASNLVSGDTNLASDVFLYDRVGVTTSLVSVDAGGGPANGASAGAEISSNGTWIAFDSFATDLVAGDANNHRDVFRRNRTTSVTERVSLAPLGQADGDSFDPGVTNNGGVVFSSDATNMGQTMQANFDTNGVTDVFGGPNLAWLSFDGVYLAGGFAPAVSADGSTKIFTSTSADLVPNDTNNAADIFVIDYRRSTDANCTGWSSQIECDLTANGGPVPTTVEWYLSGSWDNPAVTTLVDEFVHEPSLDNLMIVQLTMACSSNISTRMVVAAVAGGTGITGFLDLINCPIGT